MHENRETSGASSKFGDRSGKANNHKPDVYAPEESDRAVVPMKLPNKEAQASAEVVEGRALTEENTSQIRTPPAQYGVRRVPGFGGCAPRFHEAPSSEVGAVCGSAARTDLCGGRSAMVVPTATSAGINRHIVGDERALQERSSDSILASSLAPVVARRRAKRRQRYRWAGY